MRTILSIIILASTFSAASATSYVLSGNMDVNQALTNPANVGTGTGTIAGTYDDVSNLLGYTLTWQGLSGPVANAHFHVGAPGVSGGVDLAIPGPWASPYTAGPILLLASQETNLLAGLWYVNIHTAQFRGGEIRGQVNVRSIPDSGATLVLSGLSILGLVALRRKFLA